MKRRFNYIRVLYVLREAFVLRSIEVYPRFNDLVSAIFTFQLHAYAWILSWSFGDFVDVSDAIAET